MIKQNWGPLNIARDQSKGKHKSESKILIFMGAHDSISCSVDFGNKKEIDKRK